MYWYIHGASMVALAVKNLPANAGDIRDAGSIPGSGRSPGEGHGNPLPGKFPICVGNGKFLLPGKSHGVKSLVGHGR